MPLRYAVKFVSRYGVVAVLLVMWLFALWFIFRFASECFEKMFRLVSRTKFDYGNLTLLLFGKE
jgi:hypothetical protein